MNAKPEVVAICTLLDSTKRNLVVKLGSQGIYSSVDFGGRGVYWIVGCSDADEETMQAFHEAVGPDLPILWVILDEEFAQQFPRHGRDCETDDDLRYHLRWMAYCREAVRWHALHTVDPSPAWLLWWDTDIEPIYPDTAFHELHAELTETVGPRAPRQASGLFPCRHSGYLQPQHWQPSTSTARRKPPHPSSKMYVPIPEEARSSWGHHSNHRGITPVSLAGFGFRLWHRSTAEWFTWQKFTEKEWTGCGEDVYADRLIESNWGVPLLVVGTVPCRHYRDDGTYFEPEVDWEGKFWRINYCGFERIPLSVCIHAAHRDLRLPIQSVMFQIGSEDELLLVDGGCNLYPDLPDTANRIVHLADGNYPASEMQNTCIERARNPDIALLGADTVLPPGRIEQVRQQLAAFPDSVAWTPAIMLDQATSAEWRRQNTILDFPQPPKIRPAGPYGVMIAAKREALLALRERDGEIFDTNFTYWGGEDTDFFERWPGKKVELMPVFHLWHEGSDLADSDRPGVNRNWEYLVAKRHQRRSQKEKDYGSDAGTRAA